MTAVLEVNEELVSEVDLTLDVTEQGLRVSCFIDDVEVHDMIDWRDLGLLIGEDVQSYPDSKAKAIAKKMRIVSDWIMSTIADGRE